MNLITTEGLTMVNTERQAHRDMDEAADWAEKNRAQLRRVIYIQPRGSDLARYCTPEPRKSFDAHKALLFVMLALSSVMVIGGIAGAILSMIG